MGKKVEHIEINENYNYPSKSSIVLPKDKLYKESSKVVKREIVLNKKLSFDEQNKQLNQFVSNLNSKINKLEINYAFLCLFKGIVKTNIEVTASYLQDNENFKKYLNDLKENVNNITKSLNNITGIVSLEENNNIIDKKYEEILNQYYFVNGLNSDLEAIKKKYYHEFKFASYSIIHNKSLDEILNLIERVDAELRKYRNVSNAADFIMFNSGVEIEDIVKEFCKLSDKYKYITYRYFLNTDAIILFKFQEWVELFIKFNYVLGRIDKKDISQTLMKKYHNLETKFTILLINGEKND